MALEVVGEGKRLIALPTRKTTRGGFAIVNKFSVPTEVLLSVESLLTLIASELPTLNCGHWQRERKW